MFPVSFLYHLFLINFWQESEQKQDNFSVKTYFFSHITSVICKLQDMQVSWSRYLATFLTEELATLILALKFFSLRHPDRDPTTAGHISAVFLPSLLMLVPLSPKHPFFLSFYSSFSISFLGFVLISFHCLAHDVYKIIKPHYSGLHVYPLRTAH